MKQVLSIFGGLLSFIICIVLFTVQISFLVLLSTKGFIQGNGIKEVIKNIDVKELFNESTVNTNDEIYEITSIYGISKEDTDKIIESDSLKSFVADFASENVNALLGSGVYPNIKVEDINNLIDDIIEEKEINITEENKNKIKTLLLENSEDIEEALSVGKIIEKELDPESKGAIATLFGPTLLIAFIVILIVFFLLIMLFRWPFYKALLWYGITTTLSSLTILAFGAGIKTSLRYIDISEYEDYSLIISDIINISQQVFIKYGLIFLAIGIVFIVGYVLIRKSKLNKKEEIKEIEQTA